MVLIDLPDCFPGRQSTSIEATNSGFRCCSACKALSDAALNSSEPQNKTRSGFDVLVLYNLLPGPEDHGRIGILMLHLRITKDITDLDQTQPSSPASDNQL